MSFFETTLSNISSTTSTPSGVRIYHDYQKTGDGSENNESFVTSIVIIVGVKIGLLLLMAFISCLRSKGPSELDSAASMESQTDDDQKDNKCKENTTVFTI